MKSEVKSESLYPRSLTVMVAIVVLVGLGYVVRLQPHLVRPNTKMTAGTGLLASTGTAPSRRAVYDAKGALLATFTVGSRTVVMHGPARTFAEPGATDATVTTSDWVRLYPTNFTGTVDRAWLTKTNSQNVKQLSPDVLQIAMQYIDKAPAITDTSGRTIAGDASYGATKSAGECPETADFNDYIGLTYTYNTGAKKPDASEHGSLDCSGFLRMVWGYRSGLPLELNATGAAIPRQVYRILSDGPGAIIAPDTLRQITDFSLLQAGDIVFHDADDKDGTQIDQAGMYLGVDSQGHHRFISSRKTTDGPSFGDKGAKSILDGDGLYAKTFRAIRRF